MKHKDKKTFYDGIVTVTETDPSTGKVIGQYNANKLVKRIDSRAGRFSITYLAEIIATIDAVGNSKMKVVKYILEHMERSNNTLIATTREIAEGSKTGVRTTIDTLKLLEEANIIKRRTGSLMLTPRFVNNKTAAGEGYLLTKFENFEEDESNPSDNLINFPEITEDADEM